MESSIPYLWRVRLVGKGDTSCSLRTLDTDHTDITLRWEGIGLISEGVVSGRTTDDTSPTTLWSAPWSTMPLSVAAIVIRAMPPHGRNSRH